MRTEVVPGMWPFETAGHDEQFLSQGARIVERMFDTWEDTTTEPDETSVLPDGFENMPPGLFLGVMLSMVDRSELSGHDLVVVLEAQQRMVSHYQALLSQTMVSIGAVYEDMFDGDIELAYDATSAEIGSALTLTRRAADTQLDLAYTLAYRLPVVWKTLLAGRIDVRRAKTIADATIHLSADTARAVVDQVIGDAPGLTTGQLGARIRKLAITADPGEAQDRYEHAVDNRHVVLTATDQGTANLAAYDVPPDRAARIMSRINQLANQLKTSGEDRTMDQLRTDVFLDLLDGGTIATTGKRGIVDIRVDLETLTRLQDHPGDLAGYGPVIADIARQIAETDHNQQWRYAVTNTNGQIVGDGTTRRRPTAAQRRHIETRHTTCVWATCRVPATQSDLDHTEPWAQGGPTHTNNLGPNCPHHHYLRHKTGWTYHANPDPTHTWTSPLGHKYTNKPDPP